MRNLDEAALVVVTGMARGERYNASVDIHIQN
jgi:hypothetical protein